MKCACNSKILHKQYTDMHRCCINNRVGAHILFEINGWKTILLYEYEHNSTICCKQVMKQNVFREHTCHYNTKYITFNMLYSTYNSHKQY